MKQRQDSQTLPAPRVAGGEPCPYAESVRAILHGTSVTTGDGFFPMLVRRISKALDVRRVLVGELHGPQRGRIRTVALWSDGALADNVEYALKGTHCEQVLGRESCCFPRGIRKRFPKDPFLRGVDAEGCVGVPLLGSSGQPLGLLSLIDDKPIHLVPEFQSILEILAQRGGAELERRRTEAALRESQEMFSRVFQSSPVAMAISRPADGQFIDVNDGFVRTTGYAREEIINRSAVELGMWVKPEDREAMVREIRRHGFVRDMESTFRSRTGELRTGRFSAQMIEIHSEPCVLTIAQDVTDQKEAENTLKYRVEFEELITSISTNFINLAHEDIDKGIDRALRAIGEFADVDRSYVFLFSEDASRMSNTHEWCGEDIEPAMDRLQDLSVGAFPWFTERIKGYETVHVPRVADLPPEAAAEREEWVAEEIQSLICVPMVCAGTLIGFVGFDSVRAEKAWPDEIISLLRIVGEVFANALARKQGEQALQESERSFRELFENANDLVQSVSPDGGMVYVNPAWRRTLGYTDEEIAGLSLFDIIDPTELDHCRQAFERVLSGETASNMETVFVAKDGRKIAVEGNCSARLKEGKPVAISGVFRDVTERRAAEHRAETERRFSESLIETAPAFIVGIDSDGKTTFMNAAMAGATGYKSAEVVGRDYASLFVPKEERANLQGVFDKLLTGAGPAFGENHILTKDGRKLLVVWHGNPVYDEQGNVSGCYGIGEDITEKRLLEEQLRQAQKMESIGTLAGGIAHDFNNLLTVILGNVSFVLAKMDKDSDLYRSLADVEKAGERAGSLVQQMLAFSRKTILQMQPTDLQQCVDESVALLRRGIDPKIEIRVRSHPSLWLVRADRNQMNQVIMNLCVNAWDAMPDGGELTLETENSVISENDSQANRQARPGEFVKLTVADTGVGMDEVTLNRIFEPFFTTKKVGVGTGLGLAMVYGIVTQHGGWISVESRPRKGTRFHIFLPRTDTPSVTLEAQARSEMPRGSETILLVDDEELVADTARRILTGCGYTVMSAVDGDQAVKVFRKHHREIDLVLLDIALPKMDGYEVVAALRKIDPNTKIIFCTGQGARVHDVGKMPPGVDLPMLRKPLRAAPLAALVRKVLDAGPDATG